MFIEVFTQLWHISGITRWAAEGGQQAPMHKKAENGGTEQRNGDALWMPAVLQNVGSSEHSIAKTMPKTPSGSNSSITYWIVPQAESPRPNNDRSRAASQEYQTRYQTRCQRECQNRCQAECQNRCQTKCQNEKFNVKIQIEAKSMPTLFYFPSSCSPSCCHPTQLSNQKTTSNQNAYYW